MNGFLCLHRRNYKLILVDESDWIYCEFFDLTNNGLNKQLKIDFLLKKFSISNFNVVFENIHFKSNQKNVQKMFFYLQIDVNSLDIDESTITYFSDFNSINARFNNEDLSFAIIKTYEMMNMLSIRNLAKNKPANETKGLKENNYTFEPTNFDIIKNDPNHYYYIFKVKHVGSLNSLATSQFKSKLRADINIEIFPATTISGKVLNNRRASNVVLSLMGKYLFYYSFLYVNNFYLIKSDKLLDLNFNNFNDNTLQNILFLADDQIIIDHFDSALIDNKLFSAYKHFDMKELNLNKEFIDYLKGTLIDKQLKTNTIFEREHKHENNLLNHFDLLIPSKEFKLLISVDNQAQDIITLYYDTRYAIYETNIVPGMQVEIFNLIKKGDTFYKSSSKINAAFCQSIKIDDSSIKQQFNVKNEFNLNKQKLTIFNKLNQLSNIYEEIYSNKKHSNSIQNDEIDRASLLFKTNIQCFKVMGYVRKIYELTLKLKCKLCNLSSCYCSNSIKDRVELNMNILIDDHTSLLKLTYVCNDYQLKYSYIFAPIADYLFKILTGYLNEIRIPRVPVNVDYLQNSDLNTRIRESIREKLRNENQLEHLSINSSNTLLNNETLNCSEDAIKIDIHKAIYDYLAATTINKYFIFYVESNLGSNKFPNKYNELFKLSEIHSNEQYKSMRTAKCFNFVPLSNGLNES